MAEAKEEETPQRLRAQTYITMGINYFSQRRYQEALEAYEQAIAADPSFPNGYVSKANALILLDRAEEAVTICDGVIAREPREGGAYVTKATALHRLGRAEEALAWYRQALEVEPDLFMANYDFACYWAIEGNEAETERYLRRALEIKPQRNALAATDPDFSAYRERPWFQELVAFKREGE